MTCIDGGSFEFLTRPYNYKRAPFQLTSGELVTYEGIYFSLPASGLMLDKRLFTDSSSHPVDSSVKLYINRDAGVAPIIEPDDDGAVYQSGTPHYDDYVLDMRTLISEVAALHAADSDHTAQQFFEEHLQRVRATYDLSAHDIRDGVYVHPEPVNTVPSGGVPPGSSGSVQPPGDGFELGAQQLMDIDIDEIQWQPITRPKDFQTGTPENTPIEPVFPIALPDGELPVFSSLDESNLNDIALGVSTSGGILVTGDNLIPGTSLKLFATSGISPAGSGNFVQTIPWKLFPCEKELCRYYALAEDQSGVINVKGRQAVYQTPGSISTGVYMLAISDSSNASGTVIQHYPINYHAISGIDADGKAHDGIHVVDKLIYNLNAFGGTGAGHSPINGKKVLTHWVGNETSSRGKKYIGTGPRYVHENLIYGFGEQTDISLVTETITHNWATANHQLSPVTWNSIGMQAQQVSVPPFSTRVNPIYRFTDSLSSTRRIVSLLTYLGGKSDRIVTPDQPFGLGSRKVTRIITYDITTFREGTNPDGSFKWIEDGTSSITQEAKFFANTFPVFAFAAFFAEKPNHGFVHVNGDVFMQFSFTTGGPFGVDILPRNNKFASIGDGIFTLFPTTTRSDVVTSIGFFPAWKLVRTVTTNNQVQLPSNIAIGNTNSPTISFDPELDFDESTITDFGPAIWNPDVGINYIYFLTVVGGISKIFFAHMDTDFIITRINETNLEGFIAGRLALLDI